MVFPPHTFSGHHHTCSSVYILHEFHRHGLTHSLVLKRGLTATCFLFSSRGRLYTLQQQWLLIIISLLTECKVSAAAELPDGDRRLSPTPHELRLFSCFYRNRFRQLKAGELGEGYWSCDHAVTHCTGGSHAL